MRIWSGEGADVIFVSGTGRDVILGMEPGLIEVLDFLAELVGAVLGVVVALQVTLLCKHEMSLCIVQTSSSFILASIVCCSRSCEFSARIWQMSLNSYLAGQRQVMSRTHCQHLEFRDSMSETQYPRLNV